MTVPVDDLGRPTYPPPDPEGPVHPMAVASLVLSIVWLLGAGSLLALVFGVRARQEIDREPYKRTGRGIATTGIVMGCIGIVGAILFVIAVNTVDTDGSDGVCEEARFFVDPDC